VACSAQVRVASPDSGLAYGVGVPMDPFKYSMRGNHGSYVGQHSIQVVLIANVKETSLGWGVVHKLDGSPG
jgi:hypothetical protein